MKNPFNRIKKCDRSAVGMGIFLALVFVMFLGGALFAQVTEPENLLSEGRDVAAYDTVMLCESDENEEVYIPTSVAADQFDEEQTEQTDDALKPEEEDDPEEPEEPEKQEQREKQQPEIGHQQDRSKSRGSSGTSGGGGEGEKGGTTNEVFFTTSIKDGATVTDPTYAFSIRHLRDDLKVKKVTVSVNGTEINQFKGAVPLTEGTNTIRVKVDYTDSSGKIVASPYKDYTVILDTQSLVITTSIKDNETVTQDQYLFTASASYKGEDVPLDVLLNGKGVNGSEGKYRVKLKNGNNVFVLSAAAGGLEKKNQYIIIYQSDGVFDFGTDLEDGAVVATDSIAFSVWMINGVDAQFTVKHGNKKVSPDGEEHFTVSGLNYGENTITITARSGEQDKTRSYKVTFKRPEASEDNPIPDRDHAPTVETVPDLTKNGTTKNSVFTLDVIGYDYKGNRLTAGNMKVYLNGSEVRSDWQTTTRTTYELHLSEENNTVKIFLKDNEGYTALYTYSLRYERTDGPIGQAIVSVEATTLGLGYILPPTPCDIYSGQPASYVVERFFEQNGITTSYTGTLDDEYFLERIYKPGITDGYKIPDNLLQYLDEYGASESDTIYSDSLGSADFYGLSGWCLAINEDYPGYSLATVNLRDGDRLQIRYTLHLGMDIGGGGNGGAFPEKFIEPY